MLNAMSGFVFTPPLFDNLLEAMHRGITVTQWLELQQDFGNPISRTALTNYVNADSARKSRYALAREECAHALAEDVVKIADSGLDPQRTANRMKARQWLASKLKPKDYGDKLDIDVKGQIDVQAAVLAGRRRIQTIEHAPQSSFITSDTQSDVALDQLPAPDPFS